MNLGFGLSSNPFASIIQQGAASLGNAVRDNLQGPIEASQQLIQGAQQSLSTNLDSLQRDIAEIQQKAAQEGSCMFPDISKIQLLIRDDLQQCVASITTEIVKISNNVTKVIDSAWKSIWTDPKYDVALRLLAHFYHVIFEDFPNVFWDANQCIITFHKTIPQIIYLISNDFQTCVLAAAAGSSNGGNGTAVGNDGTGGDSAGTGAGGGGSAVAGGSTVGTS